LQTGCWIWKGKRAGNGYGELREGGRGTKRHLAHRVSWQIHRGAISKGVLVLHTCDNPPCVNPNHLFLGTVGDNSQDAMKKGRLRGLFGVGPGRKSQPLVTRVPRGEAHYKAKLTEEQVREIRSDSRTGRQIAADYGISDVLVSQIKKRKVWKHI
jgi:hypothetical protein